MLRRRRRARDLSGFADVVVIAPPVSYLSRI
jgi:hypothetical protein